MRAATRPGPTSTPPIPAVSGPRQPWPGPWTITIAPEINSIPVGLPGINAEGVDCGTLPDQTAVSSSNAWTDSFQNIQCYDQLKVNSILNEIDGQDHSGKFPRPRPNLFGMNFQAVSVGQKLIEKSLTPTVTGGYQDAIGTPTAALLDRDPIRGYRDRRDGCGPEGQWHLLDSLSSSSPPSTGKAPSIPRAIWASELHGHPITTSPATILDNAGCLPSSESPSNPTGIGPTEDDISLVWLNSACTTDERSCHAPHAVSATTNIRPESARSSPDRLLTTFFNKPGLPPDGDPRTPDIVITPDIGVTYSGSGKKLAEHGGFSRDDTNVIMLVSNPSFDPKTVSGPVETMQVAPTVLKRARTRPRRPGGRAISKARRSSGP